MKTLLLAAGLGTRMKPFTFYKAKATLPLLNVPFVHYPLQYLHSRKISDIVINLHAHPESVREAAQRFSNLLNLQFSYEPEILGTAGAIRRAFGEQPSEFFAVMNADMLMDIPLEAVLEQHIRRNSDVTLVIMDGEHFPQYGGIYFEPDAGLETLWRFCGLREGYGKRFHYAGLQIVNGKMLEHIPTGRKLETFTDVYLPLAQQKRIHGFVYDDFWLEIGNLKEYLKTSSHLIQNPLPAHLQPPGIVYNLVSPNSVVENGAEVSESIIMDGAFVKNGVKVERSIVGWDVEISRNVRDAAIARGILPWPIESN